MVNRFFDIHGDVDRELPRRAYVLIDQRKPDRLLLEGINADWYDRAMLSENGTRAWLDLARDAPIFVLELSVQSYNKWRPVALPLTRKPSPRPGGPPRWIEIDFGTGADEGLLYPNLFAEPRSIPIAGMRPTSDKLAVDLSRAFSLDDHVSEEPTINRALALSAAIEWVGVYDVGQGSANGLCDRDGVPLGYFDLGGGVLGNLATFPMALSNFCTTYTPPVVLSHWDWDHWSSGARFGQLTALTWVVPNQQLGAVHAAFAANIVTSGRLLVWPAGLPYAKAGQIRVEQCSGTGRNHSGLAMLVAGPQGESAILLPGDARYTVVPSGRGPFTSVVAPITVPTCATRQRRSLWDMPHRALPIPMEAVTVSRTRGPRHIGTITPMVGRTALTRWEERSIDTLRIAGRQAWAISD